MGGRRSAADRRRKAGRASAQNGAKTGDVSSWPDVSFDSGWFWARVSGWLPLWEGSRTGLRLLSRTAADAVVEALEREEDPWLLWSTDVFGGLLPDLERLAPCERKADGLDACPQNVTASDDLAVAQRPLPSSSLRSLRSSSLQKWFALAQRFLPQRRTLASRSYLLFGASRCPLDAVADDVTERLAAIPSGTLLWLEGRLAVSNCFNSLVHFGRDMSGPWFLRKPGGRRLVLQRFGDTLSNEVLDEFRRLCGRVLLPHVRPEWTYVVNVSGDPARSSTAEVLRAVPQGMDPIERVVLPPRLAAAALEAVVEQEDEEALLLRWTVEGQEPTPMRIAVYSAASPHIGGPVRVVDEVLFTSHSCFALAPSSPCATY
mmetsp:Transcript_78679/g.218500  ORF Transcript_78679/g.218500 Transcript_78679/m.218500 type:complete len:374 (-) Transcript_78679:112-1233(-)